MTHISITIFGLVEDDTPAVLKSVWTDYPVIRALLLFIAFTCGIYYLIRRLQKIKLPDYKILLGRKLLLFIFLCFVFVCGLRGSFGLYPLRIKDSVISSHVFINNLVINGVYALKTAFGNKMKSNVHVDIQKTMNSNGFTSLEEAISVYAGIRNIENQDSLVASLYTKTPVDTFLEKNPPHIVFVLMESMSEYFISLHEKNSFNLLGELENVLPECIHFTHFLPAGGTTIQTLEALVVNSPMTSIAQSAYMNESLETSSAKPFKERGYRTTFVTGGKLEWRNIDKFIPKQYFDESEGVAQLKSSLPDVISNEWGCYDEFVFDRAFDKLKNASKPNFLFVQTTTNHTPYSLPSAYSPYPLIIPAEVKKKLVAGEDLAKSHFLTYQYANDCLGRFIQKVKSSAWGENTIIIATGDHSARRIFDFADANMLQKYAVPLIMYLPDKYKPSEMPDTSCFASHRDIFPTIYNLSISDVSYVNSGINLFDKKELDANTALAEYQVLMNRNGCVYFATKPVYFTWTDSARVLLKPAKEKDTEILEKEMIHEKAFIASMTYLVQKCLLQGK